MAGGQVAAIRSALLDLVDAQERDTRNAANLCAMISVSGRHDSWVQVQLGMVNFAYPHHEHPIEFLKRHGVPILRGLAASDFGPNKYATLTYDPCSIEDLAHFVDALLIAVHPLPQQDYGIDVECEYLLEAPTRRRYALGTWQCRAGGPAEPRPRRSRAKSTALKERRESPVWKQTSGNLHRQ